jgi:hypothetical protein
VHSPVCAIAIERDLIGILRCHRFDGLDDIRNQRRKYERREGKLLSLGINLGEVEDVVDQSEQMPAAPSTRSSGSNPASASLHPAASRSPH